MRLLLLHDTEHDLPAIESVLSAHGYRVKSIAANALTVEAEIAAWNPEVILIAADNAARDMIEQICVMTQFRERPIVMFTEDDDREAMRSAMQARVAAYVVQGMKPERLRSVIDVALERFRQDQLQYAELAAISQAAERQQSAQRVVAQAKALLRRRGMTEPEAYAALRSQAMQERCTVTEIAERLLAARPNGA